jgi:hypothetical protein
MIALQRGGSEAESGERFSPARLPDWVCQKLTGQRGTLCYYPVLMLMQRKSAFSRRLPDLVTEELVAVLSKKSSFEFKQLFDVVHERLRARNAASGGEEMLRLRAYEKLQNLVSRGMVKKTGKKYKGLASLAKALTPPEPVPAGK